MTVIFQPVSDIGTPGLRSGKYIPCFVVSIKVTADDASVGQEVIIPGLVIGLGVVG